MVTDLLLPWLPGLRLDAISATDTTLALVLTAIRTEAICPLCAQSSGHIHSRYTRTVADLPWAGRAVQLQLHVRKFFCRNPACPRLVFTERQPALVAPSARRTLRLWAEQRQLALDQGGLPGARTAARQGMPISARTLLRFVRGTPLAPSPTPRILGVDDFAFRKGRTYGTILVDLRVHKRITSRCLDLRSILVARVDGVVPLRTDRMIVNVEGCHLVIRHLLSRLIGGRHQMRLHRQPRLRGGERNVVEY